MYLYKAMVLANISLNKLSNEEFRTYLEIYCGKDILTESVIRKLKILFR